MPWEPSLPECAAIPFSLFRCLCCNSLPGVSRSLQPLSPCSLGVHDGIGFPGPNPVQPRGGVEGAWKCWVGKHVSRGHRVMGGFLEDEATALGVSGAICGRERGTWRCEFYISSFLPLKGSEFGRLQEPWKMCELWQVGRTIQSAVWAKL